MSDNIKTDGRKGTFWFLTVWADLITCQQIQLGAVTLILTNMDMLDSIVGPTLSTGELNQHA